MARLRLPSGSRAFRQEGVTPDVTALGTVTLGPRVSIEANALLAVPRDASGSGRFAQWTYAATTSVAVGAKWTAFAELASLGPPSAAVRARAKPTGEWPTSSTTT